jgi:hypothetical protein
MGVDIQFAETKMRQYKFSRSFVSVKAKPSNPTFWSKLSTLPPSLSLFSTETLNKVSENPSPSSRRCVAQQLRYKRV